MAKILTVLLIPAFLSQVFCLQCNMCHGEYDCVGQNVTCEDPSASCTTSVRKAYVSFLEFQSIRKGCASQLYPPESISINSHLLSLSYQARYCAEDGCNNETYFVTHPAPANHMRCHTCASQGAWCPETSRTQITCVGDQDQCMDMDITGKLGQYSNLKLKGCTNMQRCKDILSFYSGSHTIHASCCNTPLCNSFTPELPVLSQEYNGLECYSCMDDEGPGSGCSSKFMSKVKCTGPHTMCLEGAGNSRRVSAGKDLGLKTFKGCASPAMCQSSLLSLVQELDGADVICCQGNLCNNRIIDGMVMGARVSADSADITEVPECVEPTPATPSVASRPECIYTEEERNANVTNPAGVPPSPGCHVNTETNHAVREKEVTEDCAAVTASPHHEVHSVTGKHTINDNLSRGPFEGNHVSPTGSPGSESPATSGSSLTANLDKGVSGDNSTSSHNHGNVVVLIPVIISRKNNTASTVGTISSSSSSSSSSETNANNRVLEASSNKEEEEECEAEEEDVTTGDRVIAVGERNQESSTPEGTAVPTGGNSNADVNTGAFSTYPHQPTVGNAHGVHSHTVHSHSSGDERFTMEGNTVSQTPMPGHSVASNHATSGGENFVSDPSASQPGHSTSRPSINSAQPSIPFVTSKDSESFVPEGNNEAGVATVTSINTFTPTNSLAGTGIISGAGATNAHPKNKVPCKRPGSQRQPGGTLAPSSRAEKRSQDDGVTREATNALFSETKNPRNDIKGKVNPNSGGVGLTSTLHLFSLNIILVSLLH